MSVTRSGSAERAGRPLRSIALAALSVSLLALFGSWAWERLHPAASDGAGAVTGDRAEVIVRHTEVAFADAQAVWSRAVAGYDPAVLVFFTGSTPTPCAGGATVSGPFYCPETGTASFDLRFIDALAGRLQRQRDLGIAIVAARLSAEHFQREVGLLDSAALRLIGARRARRAEVAGELALQADCLAGVWAALAASSIGPVPAEFYGQLVWSWRNVAQDMRRAGIRVPPEFDPFAPAAQQDRAAAFTHGYAAAALNGCPAPAGLTATH